MYVMHHVNEYLKAKRPIRCVYNDLEDYKVTKTGGIFIHYYLKSTWKCAHTATVLILSHSIT